MNDELKLLAKEYIEKVESLCVLMLEGLNLKTQEDWFNYRKSHQQMEYNFNGNKFTLHGKGCMVSNKDTVIIDWDFGRIFGTRWCGIDPWKLASYIKLNHKNLIDIYDGSMIKREFEQSVILGQMVEKDYLYYFTIPTSEIYEPDFPKEFDTLIIDHYDSQWIIERSKLVDRLIRKSKRVWKHNGEGTDVYILTFLLNDKKIFSVPYEDIGYQESAVAIMKVLLKQNEKNKIM